MKFTSTIFSISFMVLCVCVNAQGFLKTNGPQIVNEKGEAIILRGVGLGGWMLQEGYMLRVDGIGQQQHEIRKHLEELVGIEKTNAFYDAWLSNHTRKIDIDSMATWGFNSVRLPMHYNLYTLPIEEEPIPGKQTWLEKGFAMTDSLLQWCKANHMYLILDLHAAPGGQGNDLNISDRDPEKPSLWQSEANQQKMIALWRKLAERYVNEPWIGAYDIINEPNWGFTKEDDRNGCDEKSNGPLRKLMIDITKAIREVDQRHIIIVEGNCWGNNYEGVFPLWDKNMVISFHKYWNYNNLASLEKIMTTRTQQNAPIWLGESGENSNVWFRDAIHLVESQQIGWAWWPLKKLGFNNPLEVKVPAKYQQILDFWAEKGPKPSADDAYQGLMALAENLKIENCIYHKDVVDAMFRQVKSDETVPFKLHRIGKKTTIHATDYDMGRNSFAYFDRDTANYWVSNGDADDNVGNRGHVYRNDGVDILPDSKNPGSYYIGHIESGEWLQYTISVSKKGTYRLGFTVASYQPGGKLTVATNQESFGTAISVPSTKGPEDWVNMDGPTVSFKKGKNTLRIKAENGGYNLKEIQITSK